MYLSIWPIYPWDVLSFSEAEVEPKQFVICIEKYEVSKFKIDIYLSIWQIHPWDVLSFSAKEVEPKHFVICI